MSKIKSTQVNNLHLGCAYFNFDSILNSNISILILRILKQLKSLPLSFFIQYSIEFRMHGKPLQIQG